MTLKRWILKKLIHWREDINTGICLFIYNFCSHRPFQTDLTKLVAIYWLKKDNSI